MDIEMIKTIPGMFSDNYLDRMVAEESQLWLRLHYIHKKIENPYLIADEDIDLLKAQEKAMMEYLKILRKRIYEERFMKSGKPFNDSTDEYIEISGSRGAGRINDLLNRVRRSANCIEYLVQTDSVEKIIKIKREAQWIQKQIDYYLEDVAET